MAKGKATPAKRQPAIVYEEDAASVYERQRQERIKENQARLEALGLPALSSSLTRDDARNRHSGDGGETKKRRNDADEDNDYLPSDDGPSSHSESEGEVERKNRCKGSSSAGRQRSDHKEKIKINSIEGRTKKRLFDQEIGEESDIHDDDTALAQAISLSLGEPVSSGTMQGTCSHSSHEKAPRNCNNKNINYLEIVGKGKRKKEITRRVQITEDEVIAYFFSFDEAGKGCITLKDLQRVSLTHDFCWSDKEIADMIYLFDTDGDGNLSLSDFQKIISRCNMLRQEDCRGFF